MVRRQFLQLSALATAGVLVQQQALAALFRTAPNKITLLRGNVGYFTERGGTIGFYLGKDGIVAIDSQFPDTAKMFIDEVKKQSAQPFSHLLNTHHHGDHSGGNIAFKGLVQQVVAHENSLKNQRAVAEKANNLDKVLLPTHTFTDEHEIDLDKEEIEGHYFGPAHTNGDAVWHFEEANIAHMGDLMFNRRHPFVDRSAGASMRNWIEVLEKTKKEFNRRTTYIFGHAAEGHPVTGTSEDLTAFQDYLQKVLQFAESAVRAGQSKEEFIKNTAIPGVTEWKGDGIQRPLTAAYEEVSETKRS